MPYLMVCIIHYLTKVCVVNLCNGSASIIRPYESSISLSSQCSTTGVTKAVVCAILSVGWWI